MKKIDSHRRYLNVDIMLSIYKDSSGQTMVNVADCETIREVKIVRMKNLGLTDFDLQMFSQMSNVEEMDISGNLLETIPHCIYLPKLRRLNCSQNKFTDLTFVQHFPNLEEVDIADNSVAFSDFCIASLLCPTLKKINNQEINIKKLNQKMEDQLKPVISKIWTDHFHATYRKSLTTLEFDALGEKFRTMLKHASIPGTKLLKKFKDFKLACLIEQFLTMVRNSPIADDLPSALVGKAKKNYTWKKPADESLKMTNTVANSTELRNHSPLTSADSAVEDGQVIVDTVESDSSAVIVMPCGRNPAGIESDTIIVFTDEASNKCGNSNVIFVTKEGITDENGTVFREVYVDNRKRLTIADQEDEERVSTNEEVEEISVEEPIAPPRTSETDSPSQALERTDNSHKPAVVESLSFPWIAESTSSDAENANDGGPMAAKPSCNNNSLDLPQTSRELSEAGERKVVKFWLYDEEIKPLRRKTPKPPSTRGRRRGNLTKYIVGPASEYSLASRRNANALDQAQSLEFPTPASIARSLYENTSRTLANSPQNYSAAASVCPAAVTEAATALGAEPTNERLSVGEQQVDIGRGLDGSPSPAAETGQFEASAEAQLVPAESDASGQDAVQKADVVPEQDNRKAGPPKKRVRFLDEVEEELKANSDATTNNCTHSELEGNLPEERLDGREQHKQSDFQT